VPYYNCNKFTIQKVWRKFINLLIKKLFFQIKLCLIVQLNVHQKIINAIKSHVASRFLLSSIKIIKKVNFENLL